MNIIDNYHLLDLGGQVFIDFYEKGDDELTQLARSFIKYKREGLSLSFRTIDLGRVLVPPIKREEKFFMYEDHEKKVRTDSSFLDQIVVATFLPVDKYIDRVVSKLDVLFGEQGSIVYVSSRGLNGRRWDRDVARLSKKP